MRKRNPEAEDLDLVPVMNLVTILIPFLLMASTFVAIAVIDSPAPSITPEPEPRQVEAEPVRVVMGDDGYVVYAPERVDLACTACPSDDPWDEAGLRAALIEVKHARPDDRTLVLAASDGVPYGAIIEAMDAARADGATDLFPEVVLAATPR